MKKLEKLLKNVEDENGKTTPIGETILKIAASILALFLLIAVLYIISFFGAYSWLEMQVRAFTGWDAMIVKGIAFILMAVFFGTPLNGFVWSFFPVPQKNRKTKRFLFLSVLAVLCFAAFFTSKEVYFNPKTGEAMQYYCEGIKGGYVLYHSDGYDPTTGTKLLPVTRDIIRKIKEVEEKKQEVPVTIAPASTPIVSSEVQTVSPEYIKAAEAKIIKKLEREARAREKLKTNTDSNTKVKKETEIKVVAKKDTTPKLDGRTIVSSSEAPHGYSVSMMKNKNLRDLINIFGGTEYCTVPIHPIACKITFQNNSSGLFYIYNNNKNLIFKIPPKRTLETIFNPGNFYYIKSSETQEYTVMRIPNREEFFLEISNSDIPSPGEIFFGSASK